jgi:hypothetical protein
VTDKKDEKKKPLSEIQEAERKRGVGISVPETGPGGNPSEESGAGAADSGTAGTGSSGEGGGMSQGGGSTGEGGGASQGGGTGNP